MMDWTLAIRRNREALLRILAALFALVGLAGQDPAGVPKGATLPRHLHAHALRILRAAESAIRRLVVIAAREVVVQPRRGSSPVYGGGVAEGDGGGGVAQTPIRIPAFPLLDPLKRFSFEPPRRASKFMPRICVVGFTEPAPLPQKPVVSPDDPVDATGLCSRLLSSRRALANLPREARRLAHWQARNRLKRMPRRVAPLRFGAPPGRRKRPTHEVDDILKECHALALDILSPPDTS
ncbi:MAG: hypothetical protein WDZ83_19740 [Rhizobiaceae bacterium]